MGWISCAMTITRFQQVPVGQEGDGTLVTETQDVDIQGQARGRLNAPEPWVGILFPWIDEVCFADLDGMDWELTEEEEERVAELLLAGK